MPFSVLDQLEAAKGALDAKGLATILGVSSKTVYKAAQARELPSYRVLGKLKFDPKVISFWYRKQSPMVAAAGKAAI